MSSGDDINRLLRRSARERQARLEAEEIASSHLSLLNEANQLLQIQLEQLNSLTSELTEHSQSTHRELPENSLRTHEELSRTH